MPEAEILVVEDDSAQRELLTDILASEGYRVRNAGSAESALDMIESFPPDLVLSDWRLPGMDGMELFEKVRVSHPLVAFVIVTAYGTIARAVEAVRVGADDYLPKPFERQALLLSVERTLRSRQLIAENERLHEEISQRDRLVDLIGRAPCMLELYRVVEKVAETEASVLVRGESGTGKELAARALHALSPRCDAPFITLNCAATPVGLAEAVLFGSTKSATEKRREGKFEAARGGTLFLDEIGELPQDAQPQLLRALQERRFTPVGSSDEQDVDLRLVAATSLDLEQEVAAGRFREDLYYRLAVVPMVMPPLRERRADVPRLIEYFTERATKRHARSKPRLSSAVMRRLLDYTWPGNVRELETTVERLVLLADEDTPVTTEELPDSFLCRGASATEFTLPPEGLSWDTHERELLRQALEHTRGNRTRAAALLDMPYKAFLYRLEKHGLKQAPAN
ncbi:MAG: DNA-binding NtrC family response regulator [Planctomycetota bacterium]|jgi:DNA-binding NtrC family response regulator